MEKEIVICDFCDEDIPIINQDSCFAKTRLLGELRLNRSDVHSEGCPIDDHYLGLEDNNVCSKCAVIIFDKTKKIIDDLIKGAEK